MIRREFLARLPFCRHCEQKGMERLAEIVDHIQPLALGGPDVDENKQGLCRSCNAIKTAADLAKITRARMAGQSVLDDPVYRIVGGVGDARAPTIPVPRIPVTMVCGPPGSGKTTYVARHAQSSDIVIDLDEIVLALSGIHGHNAGSEWVKPALDVRNQMLVALRDDMEHRMAWFIIAAPDRRERDRWARMLRAHVVLLDEPAAVCVERVRSDRTRTRLSETIDAIYKWHQINKL